MRTKEEKAAVRKAWEEKNKESLRRSSRKYLIKNRHKTKALKRAMYLRHRERILAACKVYREANSKKISERQRAWYLKNKEHVINRASKRSQEREKIDPNFKLLRRLRSRMSNILRGRSKHKTTLDLLGCTLDQLREHLEKRFTEGMTWDNYGKWHIDHIRPLASFDLTVPADLEAATHFSNLQPLWAEDNIKKSDSYVDEHKGDPAIGVVLPSQANPSTAIG